MRRTIVLIISALLVLTQPHPSAQSAPRSVVPTALTARVFVPVVSKSAASIRFHPGFPNLDPKIITFASPSVVDINNDGRLDIMTGDGAGCVWAWDHNGRRLPGFPWKTRESCNVSARISSPLAIADIDGDGSLEVAAGTRGVSTAPGERGRTFVWRANGTLLPGWPKEMEWGPYGNGGAEVYGVVLANMIGDDRPEVIAGTSNNSSLQPDTSKAPNVYAWRGDGTLLPGYPPMPQRAAGIYGTIGAADLDRDGYADVVAGRDHPYIHVYGPTADYLPGWPVRTYVDPAKGDYDEHMYMEFTQNPQAMGDLDGDGTVEVVTAAKVRDPLQGRRVVACAVLVLEPDGQRRAGWTVAKLGGAPLYNDFPPEQAPALADLDGDGALEIIVALFDGTIRAYRENGAQLWSYNYAQGKRLYGSEPVIGDITGDGRLDVIFGTYSPDGSANAAARLHALDANGVPLADFPLALPQEGTNAKQGLRAAPTLADIDDNGTVEIIAGSQGGTIYVWDLPARYRPDLMPWPTSRQNNARTGWIEETAYPAPVETN